MHALAARQLDGVAAEPKVSRRDDELGFDDLPGVALSVHLALRILGARKDSRAGVAKDSVRKLEGAGRFERYEFGVYYQTSYGTITGRRQ